MKVSTFNGCKVYDLAPSKKKNAPMFLSEKKKRELRKDDDYRRRVELIQDFDMPTACTQIEFCNDGEHILVSGTYPPVIKCFTLSDLSMKFQRGLNSEVIEFRSLSDDYGKICLLHVDRYLSFHAPYGNHYTLRIPKQGRSMTYCRDRCDIIVGGEADEIYRLNLESGQFKEPLTLSHEGGCNKVVTSPIYPLLACGGSTGVVDFFDTRNRKRLTTLQANNTLSLDEEITAIQFDDDGLTLGVGTSKGKCLLYDIRSSRPLYVKHHQYGLPIIDVTFHQGSNHIISTDKKIVKIWSRQGLDHGHSHDHDTSNSYDVNGNENDDHNINDFSSYHNGSSDTRMGKILTNVETPAAINNVHIVRDQRGPTGLMLLAGEQEQIMQYFIPDLGPAPRWCSHLEGITEELEEAAESTVYDDYKFLTRAELEEINATSLIGTPSAKAYMHGFFIEMPLYRTLRAAAKPFEYEEFRKKKIRQVIEEKRNSRISVRKRIPKVNAVLAEKLSRKTKSEMSNTNDSEDNGDDNGEGKGLVDDRFKSLFERPEFEQDFNSMDFKLRNPTTTVKMRQHQDDDYNLRDDYDDDDTKVDQNGDDYRFNKVDISEDEDDDDVEDESDGAGDMYDYDDDSEDLDAVYADELKEARRKNKKGKIQKDNDSDDEGAIVKMSRRVNEKYLQNQQKRSRESVASLKKQKSKLGKSNDKKKLSMFELAEGENNTRSLLSHTSEERERRRIEAHKQAEPLMNRLYEVEKDEQRQHKSRRVSEEKVRVYNTQDGPVKELSFIPQVGQINNKDKNTDKKARNKNKGNTERGGAKTMGNRGVIGAKESREAAERTVMMGGDFMQRKNSQTKAKSSRR